MSDGVGLAEAIKALRADLQEAVKAGASDPLRFTLSPIELTLQVEVTSKGEAGVGWHIVKVGGSLESASTQTLKLTLTPNWVQPNGTVLSGDQVLIASQSPEPPRFS